MVDLLAPFMEGQMAEPSFWQMHHHPLSLALTPRGSMAAERAPPLTHASTPANR